MQAPRTALVERRELNDARVITAPFDHRLEVIDKERHRFRRGAAVLLHHILEDCAWRSHKVTRRLRDVTRQDRREATLTYHTALVRVVVPALRVDLLVQSDHVEPEHGDRLHVVGEALVRRRRVLPVRPPALVEERPPRNS